MSECNCEIPLYYCTDRPDCKMVARVKSKTPDEIATLRAQLAAAEARAERLADLLGDIGDRAHDASSGPAVPDALWEIRGMAYEGVRADGAALAEGEAG